MFAVTKRDIGVVHETVLICELGSNKASGLQFFSDVNEILIVPCKVWINFGTNVLKDSLSYGD